MLTSRQLMKRAGISRATLNNYIQSGILPKPVVKKAEPGAGRAPRIGHFPDFSLEIIDRVAELKKRGIKMADVVSMIDHDQEKAKGPTPDKSRMDRRKSEGTAKIIPGDGLQLTLDQVTGPAYLVNGNFEVEWANQEAREEILGTSGGISGEITERNLFSLCLRSGPVRHADGAEDLLKFHLGIAKRRLSKSVLLSTDVDLSDPEVDILARLYDESEPAEPGMVLHAQINLAPRGEKDRWFDVYASFFREGVFFAFSPMDADHDSLMALLARRDIVIRDLLKRRKPYLTPLAVVVADIQNSVKICADLPPEEYFELINQVWGAMEPKLRNYYATYGKHVGDGMVYYFFPQPDSNYVLNALRCAHEMKAVMEDISAEWKKRKNWTNDLMLNIGLVEGREWFGTYQTPTHIEFTVLGDTINMAGRLSDFAREGSVWVTKNMLGQLTEKERQTMVFGIRRQDREGGDILVPNTYSRISNLVDLDNPKYEKFRDIAVLPVAEVVNVELKD
ncbi:MAG: adenylate/guanylate cyclase domain-containing protein [Rhodospirillales bacterium]|nr:adenylate/guanylate cyclase domain-containing protein [Rhodospirillales bacterium]